jgi:hypothetical protein
VLAHNGKVLLCRELALAKALPSDSLRHACLTVWCSSKQSATEHVTANPDTQRQKGGESGQVATPGAALAGCVSDPQRALILLIWVSKVSQRPSHSNDGRKVDGLGVGGLFVDEDVLGGVVRNWSVEVSKGAGACAVSATGKDGSALSLPPIKRAWTNHHPRLSCVMRLHLHSFEMVH